MNRSFINLIVEGYISDNELELETKNSAAQQVIDLMDEIKENDYELYNYIHSLPKTKQKDFIYRLLNEGLLESAAPFVNLGLIVFVILFVVSAYSRLEKGPDWYQSIANFVSRITSTVTVAIKSMKKNWTKSDTAIDYIISNNYHDCISKCEISGTFATKKGTMARALSKIYSEDGFSGVRRAGLLLVNDKEFLSPAQLECLVNCSLDSLSTIIAKYAGLYINCVKKSDVIYSDIKIYNTLDLGRLPSDISSCNDLRNNYKDLFDDYIYILDFLFKGHNRKPNADTEHVRWLSILDRKINATSENNYSKILDISKQYVGDNKISNPAVRF